MAGHLPLLEAYPSLPLLLWLIEVILQEPPSSRCISLRLLALSAASSCVIMAGHPQLPAYALGAAVLYLFYRGGRSAQVLKPLGAIILGIGSAGFVLWPMFQLIRRSTRLLPLDTPENDVLFPYQRLAAYLFPWKDGFPDPFVMTSSFTSHSKEYFWDTVCYVGWLPLLALIFFILRGKLRVRPWPFLILLGSLALILALPVVESVRSLIPTTILRSPARQIYLTTFALALILGGALDSWLRNPPVKMRAYAMVAALLAMAVHVSDLGRHASHFIRALPSAAFGAHSINETWLTQIGDGRIAMDTAIASPLNREIDDIGFFDSVILARTYCALLDLAGKSPTSNVQKLDGSQMSARALATTATKLVVTSAELEDLPRMSSKGSVHVYAIPLAASRASFLPFSQAAYLNEEQTHERLRDPSVNLAELIMLPADTNKPPPQTTVAPNLDAKVTYERPSSDLIVLKVRTNQAGFLRVLESFDPGWSADVDGTPATVLPADGFALAIRLETGVHEVHLRFATPGVKTGVIISLISLLLLVPLIITRRPNLSVVEL